MRSGNGGMTTAVLDAALDNPSKIAPLPGHKIGPKS